jgi:urate oxidase
VNHRPTLSAIDYGKGDVSVYRFAAAPYRVPAIPESPFTGRAHDLFAAHVGVQVLGGPFEAAYTEGDNRNVVATDTMKNFVLKHALAFEGATLEAFLGSLGRAFFETYPDMTSLHLTGREVPFVAAPVRQGEGFVPSPVLLSRSRDDHGAAELLLERGGVRGLECGRLGLQLLKTTGSSFTSFSRDAYTTLPEMHDRPLFIYLDACWRYRDPATALQAGTGELEGYVPSEQVRDLLAATFHDVNSRSIQHLVYEMGVRLLARFPQLREVRFEAQNRLWDHAFSAEDARRKVHTDPRPPYGRIGLTLTAEG